MPLNFATKSNPATFKKALNKLGSDNVFREQAMKNPETLTKDFHLSIKELQGLRQAAILSGVDMTAINRARADEISRFAGTHPGIAKDDINISCCCCCCCGETAVVKAFA